MMSHAANLDCFSLPIICARCIVVSVYILAQEYLSFILLYISLCTGAFLYAPYSFLLISNKFGMGTNISCFFRENVVYKFGHNTTRLKIKIRNVITKLGPHPPVLLKTIFLETGQTPSHQKQWRPWQEGVKEMSTHWLAEQYC
jgi:hypothetical protein